MNIFFKTIIFYNVTFSSISVLVINVIEVCYCDYDYENLHRRQKLIKIYFCSQFTVTTLLGLDGLNAAAHVVRVPASAQDRVTILSLLTVAVNAVE